MAFCDYHTLARRLDIANPSSSDIAEMQIILDFVLQYMKKYTGRGLEYAQYTEYHKSSNMTKLYLINIPIVDLTEVGCGVWIDDDLVTDYDVYNEYLYREAGWNCNKEIKVVFYGGYDTGSEEYTQLAWIQREIAAALWKKGGSKNFTTDEYGVANFEIADIETEIENLKLMLDYFKRLYV